MFQSILLLNLHCFYERELILFGDFPSEIEKTLGLALTLTGFD